MKTKKSASAVIVLIFAVIMSGCIGNEGGEKERISDNISIAENGVKNAGNISMMCVEICEDFRKNSSDMSRGPCLSNDFYPGWVCDCAHLPRKDADNKPENQCSAYREGRAHHFVEVDENCALIRAV